MMSSLQQLCDLKKRNKVFYLIDIFYDILSHAYTLRFAGRMIVIPILIYLLTGCTAAVGSHYGYGYAPYDRYYYDRYDRFPFARNFGYPYDRYSLHSYGGYGWRPFRSYPRRGYPYRYGPGLRYQRDPFGNRYNRDFFYHDHGKFRYERHLRPGPHWPHRGFRR